MHETPGRRKTLFGMGRQQEVHRQLQVHRFAVQLYETLVERLGIHHEQTQLALRLVESTKPEGGSVVVSAGDGREAKRAHV